MKKILPVLLISLSFLFLGACSNDDTYEKQLEAEKALIADFIKKNNIQVVTELPTNTGWGENMYYKTTDGFYIHIVDTGEINTEVKPGQTVLARYYQVNLLGDTTLRLWTTSEKAYPEEITYLVTSETTCPAFHNAISYMRRHNSEAKFIVPSKMGLSKDKNAVVPNFYHFKIKLTE